MWFRRPSAFSIVVVVGGFLGLLLVVYYNGQADYRHSPITLHKTLLNIQRQDPVKSQLSTNEKIKHVTVSVKIDSQEHKQGNSSQDSYQLSSSEFSDDDVKERASDVTGDNAREVRVSSSTPDDEHNSEKDQQDQDSHNDQNKTEERIPEEDGDRTKVTKHDRTLNTIVDEEEGDYRDLKRKVVKQKKKYFIHNWDEYDREGWKDLPLLPSPHEGEKQEEVAVVYNRVGKCGSRSVISVMRELALKNRFHFVSSLVYNRTRISPEHERWMINLITRLERPYIFQRHVHFIDFRRYAVTQPKYINIIRDPLSRMVSQYYFRRFGDGKSDRQFSGSDKYQTFDECVLKRKEECLGKKAFYIIPFFCGQDPRCKEANAWSMNMAIRNLNEHYVATGILEELEHTFQLFEKVLPQLFNGALDIYRKTVAGELDANITSMFTKHKVKPSPQVAQIMREHMKLEYLFYNIVKKKFYKQKQEFGIS